MRRSLLSLLLLAGCARGGPPPSPHYVLGGPYQAGGVWRYPREAFVYSETGLASVVGAHGRLTADGEAFDDTALAAGHPTLQLPALARITNLENGRQVQVRLNDRGPDSPARIVELTGRTAELLGAADPAAIRVRLEVVEDASRRMAAELREDAPNLRLATVPSGTVQAESLAPPPGAAQAGRVRQAATVPVATAAPVAADPAVPLRLPEAVTQVWVAPGQLMIDCGGFSRPDYADILRQRLASLGARTTTSYNAPRDRAYMVRIGPLPSVAAAEAMQLRAMQAGATDARIVVE